MKAAVISLSGATGTVTNIIVADADRDYPPDKTSILVNLPDDHPADKGWTWDSVSGFTQMEYAEKLESITASPLNTKISEPIKSDPVESIATAKSS